jgi:hypothetical protein
MTRFIEEDHTACSTYTVDSTISGAQLGTYQASSAAEALALFCRDAGEPGAGAVTSFGTNRATSVDGLTARLVTDGVIDKHPVISSPER